MSECCILEDEGWIDQPDWLGGVKAGHIHLHQVTGNTPLQSHMASNTHKHLDGFSQKAIHTLSGYVHINTSTSLALYRFLYTSSGKHEFACILMAAVHIHNWLPVNFTRMSSFCAGRVFIQLAESKLLVNSINIIKKNRGTHLMSELTSL